MTEQLDPETVGAASKRVDTILNAETAPVKERKRRSDAGNPRPVKPEAPKADNGLSDKRIAALAERVALTASRLTTARAAYAQAVADFTAYAESLKA